MIDLDKLEELYNKHYGIDSGILEGDSKAAEDELFFAMRKALPKLIKRVRELEEKLKYIESFNLTKEELKQWISKGHKR